MLIKVNVPVRAHERLRILMAYDTKTEIPTAQLAEEWGVSNPTIGGMTSTVVTGKKNYNVLREEGYAPSDFPEWWYRPREDTGGGGGGGVNLEVDEVPHEVGVGGLGVNRGGVGVKRGEVDPDPAETASLREAKIPSGKTQDTTPHPRGYPGDPEVNTPVPTLYTTGGTGVIV